MKHYIKEQITILYEKSTQYNRTRHNETQKKHSTTLNTNELYHTENTIYNTTKYTTQQVQNSTF